MNNVDPTDIRIDPKPLYAQIAEQFASLIQSGTLRPGEKIPSQARLMAEHGVSQATVRQALLNLSNQGLVVAKQGKGVFVAEPRVNISLGVSTSNGSDFDYVPIGSDLIAAPDRVADLLDISPGSHLIRARRKLLRLGRVVGLETFNLPFEIMQSVPPQALSTGDPRTFLLQTQSGAHHQSFRISAGLVTDFDAEILDVPTDTVVLQREDVTTADNGRPILMTRSVFLADLVTLSGAAWTGGPP